MPFLSTFIDTQLDLVRTKPLNGIDGYDFESELGRGGEGSVHISQERHGGPQVAIKIPRYTTVSKHINGSLLYWFLQSLRKEIAFLHAARHPNILQLIDVFEGPPPFELTYSMPLFRHGSARHLHRKFPDTNVADFVSLALALLRCLHRSNITFRSVKRCGRSHTFTNGSRPLYMLTWSLWVWHLYRTIFCWKKTP